MLTSCSSKRPSSRLAARPVWPAVARTPDPQRRPLKPVQEMRISPLISRVSLRVSSPHCFSATVVLLAFIVRSRSLFLELVEIKECKRCGLLGRWPDRRPKLR